MLIALNARETLTNVRYITNKKNFLGKIPMAIPCRINYHGSRSNLCDT